MRCLQQRLTIVLNIRPERQELNSVFNFHHLKVDYKDGEKWTNEKYDFLKLKKILMEWQVGIHNGGGWNAIFGVIMTNQE